MTGAACRPSLCCSASAMGKETIKTLSTTWEQKMAERARSQQIKELQAELKAAAVAGREVSAAVRGFSRPRALQ